jgi:hypothetical protein
LTKRQENISFRPSSKAQVVFGLRPVQTLTSEYEG